MSDVFMLLKCNGLQYDDRVRKECESIFDTVGYTSEIHVVQDSNIKTQGDAYKSRSKYYSYSLRTRKIFKGNSFLLIKLLEFLVRLTPHLLKKKKIVWLHDPLMFVFVPIIYVLKKLGRVDFIVWDQHELPPTSFISSVVFRKIYKWSLGRVDVRIHANKERAEYLNSLLGKKYDYHILNNFVDHTFATEPKNEIDQQAANWLLDDDFVLLQSGAYEERNFGSVVEAFCSFGKQKCIVVGGSRVDLIKYRNQYKNFDDVFYFVGMIPQIRLVDYIDAAKYSLILYRSNTKNAYYCEANRLYQASCRGTPVVVGNNPPMANFVISNNNGIVLKDDGSEAKILLEMLESIDIEKLESKKVVSNWESQNEKFFTILGNRF